MALLRDMNSTFDENRVFGQRDPSASGEFAPDAAPAPPPPPVPPPVEGTPPPGGGGPPPPPTGPAARPTPPAQATMVPGIQASEATGGVQGSFAQAGTPEFNRRYGNEAPAQWFQRMSAPNQQFSGRQAATTAGGALQGGAAQAVGNGMSQEGKPQDEEWQRFIREVGRQRFGSA